MYQQSPYPPQPAFGAGAVNVPGLLGQVLGITGVGFLLTALAAYLFRDISPVLGLVAFGIAFILIFVMHGVRNNPQTALLIFYAFTFLEGIGLAPTISNYVSNFGGGIVFNAAATTGHDDRFGRRAEYMAPLDPADLYAIELWPAVATTSGGPRRAAEARVVRPDGTPVPDLYAAGGAGTVWGPFTHSGGGLTDALVFGRLAGQHAARSP